MLTWNEIRNYVNSLTPAQLAEEVKIGLDNCITSAFGIHTDECDELGTVTLIDCTPCNGKAVSIAA